MALLLPVRKPTQRVRATRVFLQLHPVKLHTRKAKVQLREVPLPIVKVEILKQTAIYLTQKEMEPRQHLRQHMQRARIPKLLRLLLTLKVKERRLLRIILTLKVLEARQLQQVLMQKGLGPVLLQLMLTLRELLPSLQLKTRMLKVRRLTH